LDGTRVLSFEEPATGGWYNGDVTMNRFDRLFNFTDATGSKDMLWVYGVGNHGGGPTRENIEAALKFAQVPFLPNVKFSTATEFFKQLEKYDLSKIPVVKTEMNTTSNSGFFGVFTTHSDIKLWNRYAEATTESAEAIAAFASRYGFEYPQKEFRRNWEEITWNHHHDTLPGTSIHPSYNKSEQMYLRTIESSRKIAADALKHLATKVRSDGEGVVVFNPTGSTRSGTIHLNPLTYEVPKIYEIENVPAFGYRFVKKSGLKKPGGVTISADKSTLENANYRVKFDASRGVVTSIFDKKRNRETIASGGSGNRLEIHWEEPNGMSAWTIGAIKKIEPLVGPVNVTVVDNSLMWDRTFQSTSIRQTITMSKDAPPEFSMNTEWKELGAGDKLCPFLKVAFDINTGDNAKFTSQIPFGTIERPIDNVEVPAVKWADLSGAAGGAAIINDCKHGYSADKNTIRLSLIRSSYYPDPRPNDRAQPAKWQLVPHGGDWQKANIIQQAEAFNHPLMVTKVASNPDGVLPAEASMLSLDADNVVVTGVKRAEDDDDLVIRFYEAYGKSTRVEAKLAFDVSKVSTVNFIEDHLSDEKGASVELRPHEIRTLKIAAKPRGDATGARQPAGNGQ
jgi:alpha-mannosidase